MNESIKRNDRRKAYNAVRIQLVIGTAITFLLGVSLGLYAGSQIIGNFQ